HIVDERIADKKDLLGRQPDSSANRGEKFRCRLAPTDLRADDDVPDRTQLRFAGNHAVKPAIIVRSRSQDKAALGQPAKHITDRRVAIPGFRPAEMVEKGVKTDFRI